MTNVSPGSKLGYSANANLGVLLEGQHNLGSTVPSCGDVFGHKAGLSPRGLGRLYASCKAEVANFKVTGCRSISIYRFRKGKQTLTSWH
jgi:hypothetical protein